MCDIMRRVPLTLRIPLIPSENQVPIQEHALPRAALRIHVQTVTPTTAFASTRGPRASAADLTLPLRWSSGIGRILQCSAMRQRR